MDALAPDGIYTYKRPCHVHVYLELYYDVCKTPIIWLYTVQPGRPEFLIKIQQNDFTSPNKQVCSVVYCVCVWVKYSDNLYHHNHYTTQSLHQVMGEIASTGLQQGQGCAIEPRYGQLYALQAAVRDNQVCMCVCAYVV
jgi:hypothetical protein